MTPVKEKAARGRGITGESGIGASRSREEAAGESRERDGRRAGVILVVIGCLLMALAAGGAAGDAPAQAWTILVP